MWGPSEGFLSGDASQVGRCGEVRKWLNRAVSKTAVSLWHRGFESHPLRHSCFDLALEGSRKRSLNPVSVPLQFPALKVKVGGK